MGNLPEARVTPPLRAFMTTGVDYCGSFLVKTSRKHGIISTKCYIALFICFTTKAIHLEVAEDMTSTAFIAAFRRFIARRGKPKDVYSDNGTNFVGACKELRSEEIFKNEQLESKLIDNFADEGIHWHFQPPSGPHFGRLWELLVKLVKTHMRRVIGTSCLTLIEFSTFLTQIEACINSRPFTAISDEPSHLFPLTPAHFLIGDVLTSIPEQNLQSLPVTRLSHWQQIQQRIQHFWSRWSREYLNSE
ncbi:uncharacterized protein LOC142317582 [Lycorma delicatula]|uniref:uncharacterized protein LOC142317582 n=1 Tax=Lycorma delicatula TaxID=130591 RepID=UPI003F51957A